MSHTHSLNSSPAKQKYSFSKASRFSVVKPPTDVSYLPILAPDRRSALIGYGQRSLTENKLQKMYPHAYDIPSSLSKSIGNSMKAGRHDIGGPLQGLRHNLSLPAPNTYEVPSTLNKNGVTLKSRLLDLSLKNVKNIPGPGAYQVPSSLSNGEKNPFQSKFSSSVGTKIPSQSNVDIRTPTYQRKQVPGPGQYDLQKYMISNPESIVQNKQGYTKFTRQIRQSLELKNAKDIPGPGQYKIFSEFDA